MLVGVALPAYGAESAATAAVMVPLGLGWIVSRGFRKVTWQFLGFVVLWMMVLTATLMPFLKPDGVQPLAIQVVLALAYLLPPAVATAMVAMKSGAGGSRARRRRSGGGD